MRIIRKPKISAAIIAIISVFYAVIFVIISQHIEFMRILEKKTTLNPMFWNIWSDFLKQGNLKYIGYVYFVSAFFIVIQSFIRKQDYDEYQVGILEKGFIVMGAIMVLLMPVMMILILSDPNYSVEAVMFLVVVHWSVTLIFDWFYIIRCGK